MDNQNQGSSISTGAGNFRSVYSSSDSAQPSPGAPGEAPTPSSPPPPYQPPQPVQPVVQAPPQQTVVQAPTPKVVAPAGPVESASEVQQRMVQSEQLQEVKRVKRTYKLENAVGVLFGGIEATLALRLIFKLFGAKPTNAFINLLYQFTGIFSSPFEGIFGGNPMFGRFELDIASIVGMVIFAILGFGALQLTKLF